MFTSFATAALFAALLPAIQADPVPSAPGPGAVFNEGGQCSFSWAPDTTGTWKVMNVELMTGDNFNMIHLTTVGSFDGTSAAVTSFSYPCPDVTPNSAIYFYQFSNPVPNTNRTWTTRFAIADATGKTTPPTEQFQPTTNAPIPWGKGALTNPADAKPPPPNGGGTGTNAIPAPPATNTTTSSPTPTPTPATTTSTPDVVTVTSTASTASNTTSGAMGLAAQAKGQLSRAAIAMTATAALFSLLF